MGILGSYKATKAINTLLTATSSTEPEAKEAMRRLRQIGAPAVPRLIEALGVSHDPQPLENLLLQMVDSPSLPFFIEGLQHTERRIAERVAGILGRSRRLDVSRMVDLIGNPETPRDLLLGILRAHRDRLEVAALFKALEQADRKTRTVLLDLIAECCTAEHIPALAERLDEMDPGARAKAARVLARFPTEHGRDALLSLLEDSNSRVRIAALEALREIDIAVPAKAICPLLRDPDITVQAAAIDTLGRIRDATLIKQLIELMQDESEYIRRAAVEVLNQVADQRAIKDLLNALRDKDWWVKVRAADALGSIGGPKVVEAVLSLIHDKDEFLRRTAVEILNSSQDERAFDYLVEALRDADWWVRERAADALGKLGDRRAIPHLERLLGQGPQARRVAIRAISAISGEEAVEPLVRALDPGDAEGSRQAVEVLQNLASEENAESIQNAITQLIDSGNGELRQSADAALRKLVNRFGDRTSVMRVPAGEQRGQQEEAPPTPPSASPPETTENATTAADGSPGIRVFDTAALKPGLVLADRYRIIKKVGAGGFGVVMLVHDQVVDEELVLKFLHPSVSSDATMIQRFIKELTYTRRITHPNVIRIYDFISIGDSYAISMEYFKSHSLAYELRRNRKVAFGRGIRLLRDVCRGMSAAQASHVVHRDLKPANILINSKDRVKIVDFGVAAATRHANTRLTRSGIMIGTPKYMAPEQIRGKQVDSRTDIYTLGVVMYEMFCGRPPYSGEDPMATLFMHLEADFTPPREVNPEIPEELAAIIVKAMALKPSERYQSFRDILQDLERLGAELES